MLERKRVDGAVRLEHVDGAPVGKAWDCEPCDTLKSRRIVQRRGEHLTRLCEEAEALLGALPVGDVVEDVDGELNLAVRADNGRGAHDRPVLLSGRDDPPPDCLGRRILTPQRRPPGELGSGHGSTVLAEELEAVHDSGRRAREELVHTREPEQARRCVVREDEVAGAVLNRDSVGDPAEDHLQLVARLPECFLFELSLRRECDLVCDRLREAQLLVCEVVRLGVIDHELAE